MSESNDIIEKIKKGDLYSLLAKCTKNDLDPLVKIILSKISNSLDVNEDYKKYKPDHTKYYKTIGDEVRSFGGHSLVNIFRGFEGPSYSEVVSDVCKKLYVPVVKDDVVQNEKNLLDLFFEARWESLTISEREKKAANVVLAASSKLSSVANIGKDSIKNLAPLVLGPTGFAIASGKNILDPSYRVTVPCVLHIAYLRRKIIDEWQKKQTLLISAPAKREPLNRSDALVIASEGGEAVLSMSCIQEPITKTGWLNAGDGVSRLNPLLQAVPGIAIAVDVANAQYMLVEYNGKLADAKGIVGAMRGYVLGEKGIESHALLYSPDRLSAMVNVSAMMNVASIVLAQKHLADISHKLTEIKTSIDGIKKFQNDQRRSELTGTIRYFEQIAPAVLEGERSARLLNTIEQHESGLLKVQQHLMEDIRSEFESLISVKDKEWFSSSEVMSIIETKINRIEELYHDLLLCIRTRAYGWQLLCAFPGEEISKDRRRIDISKSLESLDDDSGFLNKIDLLFRKKIQEISPTLILGVSVNRKKLKLLKDTESLFGKVIKWRAEVKDDLDTGSKIIQSLSSQVSLIARVENGKITGVKAS